MPTQPTPEAIRSALPRASADFLRRNGLIDRLTPPIHSPILAKSDSQTGPKPKKTRKRQRVPRTRNMGTWTDSELFSRIRSCLRRMSMFWRPAREALNAARIPCKGPRGQKWAYVCADCGQVFPRKSVQLDHIHPCGQLTDYSHVGPFLERLLPEDPKAYALRCKPCHQKKTNEEREAKAK